MIPAICKTLYYTHAWVLHVAVGAGTDPLRRRWLRFPTYILHQQDSLCQLYSQHALQSDHIGHIDDQ